MNFFGHCVVSGWITSLRPAPQGLGAMLPDLALIAGTKLADHPSDDPDVAIGVELHHRTDSIFHKLPLVMSLMRDLTKRLLQDHCSRGAARAVGHIGVELLIDAELTNNAAYCTSFVAAIEHPLQAAEFQLAPSATPAHDGSAAMLRVLQRFRDHGVPQDLQQTDKIVYRLNRMLSHRPSLAPSQHDLVIIAQAIDEARPGYQAAADSIMHSVHTAITA